jgi:hypothetical protein
LKLYILKENIGKRFLAIYGWDDGEWSRLFYCVKLN